MGKGLLNLLKEKKGECGVGEMSGLRLTEKHSNGLRLNGIA